MSEQPKRVPISELLSAESAANQTLLRQQFHTLRERFHVMERRIHDMEMAQFHGVTRMDVQANAIAEMRAALAEIFAVLGEP